MNYTWYQRLVAGASLVLFMLTFFVPPSLLAAPPGTTPPRATQWMQPGEEFDWRPGYTRTEYIKKLHNDFPGDLARSKSDAFARLLDQVSYWQMPWPEKVAFFKKYKDQKLIGSLIDFEGLNYIPTTKVAQYEADLVYYSYLADRENNKFKQELQATQAFWRTFFDRVASAELGYEFSGENTLVKNMFFNAGGKKNFIERHATLHSLLYRLGFPVGESAKSIDGAPVVVNDLLTAAPPIFNDKNRDSTAWTLSELKTLKFAWEYAYPKPMDPWITQVFEDQINAWLSWAFLKTKLDPETGEAKIYGDGEAVVVAGLFAVGVGGVGLVADKVFASLSSKMLRTEIREAVRFREHIPIHVEEFNDLVEMARRQVLLEDGLPVLRSPGQTKSPFKYLLDDDLRYVNQVRGEFAVLQQEYLSALYSELFVNSAGRITNNNATSAALSYLAGERNPAVFKSILTRPNPSQITVEEFAYLIERSGDGFSGEMLRDLRTQIGLVEDLEVQRQLVEALYSLSLDLRTQPSEFLTTIVKKVKESGGLNPALNGKTAIEYVDGFTAYVTEKFPILQDFNFQFHPSALGTNRQLQRMRDFKPTSDLDAAVYIDPAIYVDDYARSVLVIPDENGAPIRMLEQEDGFKRFLNIVWETYIRDPAPDGAKALGDWAQVDSPLRGPSLRPDFQFSINDAIDIANSVPEDQWAHWSALLWAETGDPFTYTISQGLVDRYGNVPKQIVDNLPWMAERIERSNFDLQNRIIRLTKGSEGRMPTAKEVGAAEISGGVLVTEPYAAADSIINIFRGFREYIDGDTYDPESYRILKEMWDSWFRNPAISNKDKIRVWIGIYKENFNVLEPVFNSATGQLESFKYFSKRQWKIQKETGQAQVMGILQLKQRFPVELMIDGQMKKIPWDTLSERLIWDIDFQNSLGIDFWGMLVADHRARGDVRKYASKSSPTALLYNLRTDVANHFQPYTSQGTLPPMNSELRLQLARLYELDVYSYSQDDLIAAMVRQQYTR